MGKSVLIPLSSIGSKGFNRLIYDFSELYLFQSLHSEYKEEEINFSLIDRIKIQYKMNKRGQLKAALLLKYAWLTRKLQGNDMFPS